MRVLRGEEGSMRGDEGNMRGEEGNEGRGG